MIAITIGIIVALSCVPLIRHRWFFSLLVGTIVIGLIGFLLFGAGRALFVWANQNHRESNSTQAYGRSSRLRKFLVGAALILVLMLIVPHFAMTSSAAYKLAIATAHQSPQFTAVMGTPVKEAWFSEGKEDLGISATAEMLIPVRGSIRKGNLRVLAIKNNGRWQLRTLILELTKPEEHIDLLSQPPIVIRNQ